MGTTLRTGGDLTLQAGGDLFAQAAQVRVGNDLLLMASQLKAGGDASLSAGNDIALLAGQNYSYSLSEHERKGSFGRQTHQRDEVTDLSHVASGISGGTVTLHSGGDQRYQAAELHSDGDLTLDSGGAIAFEGVKDVHQENHASSSNDWSWMKSSGEGWTDETRARARWWPRATW